MAERVNQATLADYFGVTGRSIRNWQMRKIDPLPVAAEGRRGVATEYDVRQCIEWKIRDEIRQRHPGALEGGEIIDFNAERARLTKEQADGQTLKNDVLRGQLLDAEDVTELWCKHINAAKSQLRAIKSKLQTRLPELDQRQIETISLLIDRAMNELAAEDYPEANETPEAGTG